MDKRNRKLGLPQSRYYLKAAQYGIDALVAERPMDEGFLFFLVRILASLRTVQHALLNHDSQLSEQHKAAIEQWKKQTPMDGPEITFIKQSRDLLLKAGAFRAYAARTESAITNTTGDGYNTAYYVAGERRDLLQDIRAAVVWCDRELTAIEAG